MCSNFFSRLCARIAGPCFSSPPENTASTHPINIVDARQRPDENIASNGNSCWKRFKQGCSAVWHCIRNLLCCYPCRRKPMWLRETQLSKAQVEEILNFELGSADFCITPFTRYYCIMHNLSVKDLPTLQAIFDSREETRSRQDDEKETIKQLLLSTPPPENIYCHRSCMAEELSFQNDAWHLLNSTRSQVLIRNDRFAPFNRQAVANEVMPEGGNNVYISFARKLDNPCREMFQSEIFYGKTEIRFSLKNLLENKGQAFRHTNLEPNSTHLPHCPYSVFASFPSSQPVDIVFTDRPQLLLSDESIQGTRRPSWLKNTKLSEQEVKAILNFQLIEKEYIPELFITPLAKYYCIQHNIGAQHLPTVQAVLDSIQATGRQARLTSRFETLIKLQKTPPPEKIFLHHCCDRKWLKKQISSDGIVSWHLLNKPQVDFLVRNNHQPPYGRRANPNEISILASDGGVNAFASFRSQIDNPLFDKDCDDSQYGNTDVRMTLADLLSSNGNAYAPDDLGALMSNGDTQSYNSILIVTSPPASSVPVTIVRTADPELIPFSENRLSRALLSFDQEHLMRTAMSAISFIRRENN